MLVKERMTRNPITIRPDTPVTEAQAMMKREKIHHLPVLDKDEKLVGIVSEKDLLYASPSPASTLSVYEMTSLLAKLKVDKVMSREVITATEDTPLEEAARTMADRGVGGLPIVRGRTLVGIITESDLFRIFIELFGARQRGVRVSLTVPNVKGELAKIASSVSQAGGNIITLGTFLGEDPTMGRVTLKVDGLPRDTLVAVLTPLAKSIDDVRET
ncbi:MAG TPA: CBS domain-containing protein [Spirochaetia bacterium]|nr:CBS domain-containing protein [Spirochaetia bacterium]